MRTVRKGWMRYDARSRWFRVLVDEHGFVFARGHGGWRRPTGELLKVLPVAITSDYLPFGEWWEKAAWRRPEWAWVYGAP